MTESLSDIKKTTNEMTRHALLYNRPDSNVSLAKLKWIVQELEADATRYEKSRKN